MGDPAWALGLTDDLYEQHLADVALIESQEDPAPPIAVVEEHPAKFSEEVIPVLRRLMADGLDRSGLPAPHRLLDPFAGVGRIHWLHEPGVLETWGVEIEPEWAANHHRTIVADALVLPFPSASFHAAATSCCYGNRMADSHNAQERCKPCGATGQVVTIYQSPLGGPPERTVERCEKCDGKGRRTYKRLTYTHILKAHTGRKLHTNNSGAFQWGPRYRAFHVAAWAELRRVLMVGAPFVLNVSDHIRNHQVQPVVDWHLRTLQGLGFDLVETVEVKTPRMGFGENHEARVEHEVVALLIAA